jgi:hypothetical protein
MGMKDERRILNFASRVIIFGNNGVGYSGSVTIILVVLISEFSVQTGLFIPYSRRRSLLL